MTLGTGGLVIAYVLVAALLLLLLLNARRPWWLKAAAIVIASVFYVITYASWPALLGWPTAADLPPEFNLAALYVQQPDKITGSEGAIYLWATERSEAGGRGVPRAYRFPYSVELHTKVAQAGDKLRKNIAQAGKIEKEEKAPVGRSDFARRLGQKSAQIEFYDLPAPPLPEK